MDNSIIFALDIGTCKIAGLIMEKTDEGFHIHHTWQQDQLPGAMRDGQIHHIPKVAQVIADVKNKLSEASGLSLTKAAVAAAGRSLLTKPGRSSCMLKGHERINESMVKMLELQAVGQALSNLTQVSSANGYESYLCSGYSVTSYHLDQEYIAALVGHQADTMAVEVIATFLPRVVVNSLAGALEMANLEMASMTLEPIAAIHTVVPTSMRMLNIALVDIGAGTSDIAISHQGAVQGYGMVPVAGDEVTDCLAQHFLLDFTVAERLKRNLEGSSMLECKDALGNSLNLERDQVLEVIQAPLQSLVSQVAQEVVRLNGEAPKGVILVGGGSLTPDLAPVLAAELGLSEQLVRIRQRDFLTSIKGELGFGGPQAITPISIGCAHLDGLSMDLQKVTINSQSVQFLELPDLTIGDVLLYVGTPGSYFEENSLEVTINGRKQTLQESIGEQLSILCNGQPAKLTTGLEADSVIEINLPTQAGPTPVSLADVVDLSRSIKKLYINGKTLTLSPKVLVNGISQPLSYQVKKGDDITIEECLTVGEALAFFGVGEQKQIRLQLNDQVRSLPLNYVLQVNQDDAKLDMELTTGMRIHYQPEYPRVKDIVTQAGGVSSINVTVNGESVTLEPNHPLVNGVSVDWNHFVQDNDHISYGTRNTDMYILSDVFRVYPVEELRNKPKFKIRLNGEEAGFTDILQDGDAITFS